MIVKYGMTICKIEVCFLNKIDNNANNAKSTLLIGGFYQTISDSTCPMDILTTKQICTRFPRGVRVSSSLLFHN